MEGIEMRPLWVGYGMGESVGDEVREMGRDSVVQAIGFKPECSVLSLKSFKQNLKQIMLLKDELVPCFSPKGTNSLFFKNAILSCWI